MSAHAAIAPATGVRVRRLPVGRMVIVAVVYVAIVVAAAIYPFVSPLGEIWNAPLSRGGEGGRRRHGRALVGRSAREHGAPAQRPALEVDLHRDGRRMRIAALEYVPNSVVWSLARIAEQSRSGYSSICSSRSQRATSETGSIGLSSG